jgi:hypothetical protein
MRDTTVLGAERLTETHCSELGGADRKKPGPKPNPDKLLFRTLGLHADGWEYLRKWQIEGEGDNFTPALARLIEATQVFFPQGPEVGKPRDARGRFLPSDGASKSAIQRRQRRERKEGEEHGA